MKKTKMLAAVMAVLAVIAIAPVSAMATPVGDTTTPVTATNSRSDSSLKELGISPGTITPVFSPSRLEYSASLPSGTTAIKVFATPNSPDGGIAYVTGSKTLVDGVNTVKVCCGAADGTSTVYIITVNVGAVASTPVTENTVDAPTSTDTAVTPGVDTSVDTQLIDPVTGLPIDPVVASDSAISTEPEIEENTPRTDAYQSSSVSSFHQCQLLSFPLLYLVHHL